uniref:Peptidase_M14 domain-containing protein n=1 Tax=Mesocestoides corti TaxID=53468 RepID=A0A5K3EYY2_MESCO
MVFSRIVRFKLQIQNVNKVNFTWASHVLVTPNPEGVDLMVSGHLMAQALDGFCVICLNSCI